MNPHLPTAQPDLSPTHTRQHRDECGPHFYRACLEFSQSLWLQKKPAQAILQLNKSFMADISEPKIPLPYAAMIWFLENRQDDLFIGNPVRHFQHLATRMSGPRAGLRSWRAWACFHLAKQTLPEEEFPIDHEQISNEALILPDLREVLENLPQDESQLVKNLVSSDKPCGIQS